MGKFISNVEVTDVKVNVAGVGVITLRVVKDKFSGRVVARILQEPPSLRVIQGGRA